MKHKYHDKMVALALTFPTLREAEGLHPFDPEKLDEWAVACASTGGVHAARFVLAVWGGWMGRLVGKPVLNEEDMLEFTFESAWKCGPFDVVDAMGRWDRQHQAAFVEWAKEPWWP